jgi:hypothetical protein
MAETTQLLFQWVNTLGVKLEFDLVVDDDAPQHVEVAARSVVNLRLKGECPQMVLFENIEFGDEFFAGVVPFVQSNVASEGDLAGEDGEFKPATFFCYSAWQLVVNASNITVAGLDRQANSEDEGEGDVSDLLNPPDDTTTTTTTPRTTDGTDGTDATDGTDTTTEPVMRGPSSGNDDEDDANRSGSDGTLRGPSSPN